MLEVRDIAYGYPVPGAIASGGSGASEGLGAGRDGAAVLGASLRVGAGERVALLGHNGSGKSTLLRIAAGAVEPWAGTVTLDGRTLGWHDEFSLRTHRAAVGIVGQDPDDQMVASTVFEEVAFGPCNLGLPAGEVRARVAEALDRCRLTGLETHDVSTLSGGQRQRVALAGVLAMRPRFLLLDEPCSMLDAQARAGVLIAVDEAAKAGCGVLHITHELADVIGYDRVLVMEAGRVAWEGAPRELLADVAALRRSRCLVSEALLGDGRRAGVDVSTWEPLETRADGARRGALLARDVAFAYDDGARRRRRRSRRDSGGDGALELGGHAALSGVSLEVAPGGALLVSGPTGSGKSTLLRLLAGLLTPSAGSVSVDGLPTSPAAVACSFQRAEDQLFADTVLDDVAFGPKNLGCEEGEAARRANEALRRVGLDPEQFGARSPFGLSGGQMRRVALAGILAMGTPFVALDEPTVGLDADGMADLRSLVHDLRGRGAGVVIVSHDVERCLPLVDELLVLRDGHVDRHLSARSRGVSGACLTWDPARMEGASR